MPSPIQRTLRSIDLEGRMLIGAAFFTAISVFFPWISGEWLGGSQEDYSGFSFFQSLIGWAVFLFQLAIIGMTIYQVTHTKIAIKAGTLSGIRLALAAQSMILVLAALSVLTRVTFESTRMNVRYGIYAAFIGSLVATFYAFLKFQQLRKEEPSSHFHYPAEPQKPATPTYDSEHAPIASDPSKPEEHRIRP